MKVLVTGARGFIGRHLMEALGREREVEATGYDLGDVPEVLEAGLGTADVIYHLAGVNRPEHPEEYKTGNADFTSILCARLAAQRREPVVVLSSSIQATLGNAYGTSKLLAEEAVTAWAKGAESAAAGRGPRAKAIIFRLKNVFGKWCRPNYNSVTATFCHNIARDLPITINDPSRELDLVYIDDVVEAFLTVLRDVAREAPGQDGRPGEPEGPASLGGARSPAAGSGRVEFREIPQSFRISVGGLAARIRSYRDSRGTLLLPDFSDRFDRCLYATYLSYLEPGDFSYPLVQRTDPRGSLAEFIKSASAGQLFVSRTKPGVTRGNHYHHTKTEKFLVVEGEAIIRFRLLPVAEERGTGSSPVPSRLIEHRVSGTDFKVVDIPPGYTHSIENVGAGELVTLFWASEVFDAARPDTTTLPVQI